MKRVSIVVALAALLAVLTATTAWSGMLGLSPEAADALYLNASGGDATKDVVSNTYPGLGWGVRGLCGYDYVLRVAGDGSVVATRADLMPGFFAPFTDSLDVYDLGSRSVAGSVNFSRSTTGTYVGADGLIRTAGVDEPRFGYTDLSAKTFGGLLHETGSTNFALYSESFGNWSGVSSYVDDDAVSAPVFGNQTTADGIGASSLTGYLWQNTQSTSAGWHCFSVYLRAESPVSDGCISIGKPADGYVNYTTQLTALWKRYEVEANFADPSEPVQVRIFTNQTTVKVYGFGAQLEQLSFPASYIPTYGATVTRGSDRTWFAKPSGFDDKGTVVMWTTFLWEDADVLTDNRHLVNWAGATGAQANTQSMLYENGAVTTNTTVGTNDGSVASTTTVNQSKGVPYAFGLKWGDGRVAIYRDGASLRTGTYDGEFNGSGSFPNIGLMYKNYGFVRGLVLFGHDDAEVTEW